MIRPLLSPSHQRSSRSCCSCPSPRRSDEEEPEEEEDAPPAAAADDDAAVGDVGALAVAARGGACDLSTAAKLFLPHGPFGAGAASLITLLLLLLPLPSVGPSAVAGAAAAAAAAGGGAGAVLLLLLPLPLPEEASSCVCWSNGKGKEGRKAGRQVSHGCSGRRPCDPAGNGWRYIRTDQAVRILCIRPQRTPGKGVRRVSVKSVINSATTTHQRRDIP
jgi:hypothetical protein